VATVVPRKRSKGPTGRPPGRPSKLTPEIADRLTMLVRGGVSWTAAAKMCGVGRRTVQYWRLLGSGYTVTVSTNQGPWSVKPRPEHAELVAKLRQADAIAEVELTLIIYRAAKAGDWRAATDLLERRWPERWSMDKGGKTPRRRKRQPVPRQNLWGDTVEDFSRPAIPDSGYVEPLRAVLTELGVEEEQIAAAAAALKREWRETSREVVPPPRPPAGDRWRAGEA